MMSKLFIRICCSLFQRFLGLIRLSTHSKNLTRHLDQNQGRLCQSQLFRFQNLNIVLIQNKRKWLYQFPGMFLLIDEDLVVLQIIRQCRMFLGELLLLLVFMAIMRIVIFQILLVIPQAICIEVYLPQKSRVVVLPEIQVAPTIPLILLRPLLNHVVPHGTDRHLLAMASGYINSMLKIQTWLSILYSIYLFRVFNFIVVQGRMS